MRRAFYRLRKTAPVALPSHSNNERMNYSARSTQDAILSALESAAQDSAFGYSQKRPTPAQCEAENYKVGRFAWPAGGMTLCIQNPRHSTREGKTKAGVQWQCVMAAHYGYIEGTKGADGDAVDCFIGAEVLSTRVFVINQAFGGRFDEHKVMLCFSDVEQAKSAYMRSYERGWKGLESIVECSVSQLRWWLRYGDTSKPLDPTKLPQERAPMKTTHWTSEALPLNGTVEDVLGAVREHDGTDGLLYDCATMAELLADPDVQGVLTMDAMVTPFNMLERKMGIMRSVMDRAGGTVTTTGMQVSDPFKQRGTVNVAVLYELSDGQTITALFHNPDSTPAKLAATDDLVSWKWMLNKKDVTVVAAPERGKDLNVREVARRLMRLAEKNSEAFKKANTKRAERMAAIEGLNSEIAGLETTLAKAQDELALLKLQDEEREAATSQPSHATYDVMAVGRAMREVAKGGTWFNDPEINNPVNAGVKAGWLVRQSTTQVHWTQVGIDALKAYEAPIDDPLGLVDSTYKFSKATDAFKEWVAKSVKKEDYSPFATAKSMEEAAKTKGASIAWFAHGERKVGSTDVCGVISHGGQDIARIDIGGDGKAMVFVGMDGDQRPKTDLGNDFMYSDDDAPKMVIAAIAQAGAEGDKHYSDKILDALRELGWNATREIGYTTVTKGFAGMAADGEQSDGTRIIRATYAADERRRYIAAVYGFETLFDIDGRDRDPVDVAREFNERVEEFVAKKRAELAPATPTTKDYAFSDSDTGFNEWIEGNDARYETAVAIDKAAVAAGMRIQWFKPGNATMDSAFSLTDDQDLEQYEAGELVALGKSIATPSQSLTMDAAGGVGPCAAFYPVPGASLVGSVVIEDDGGAIVYADAKQQKPMHQTRMYAGDAVQAVELMQKVKGAVFESLPAGLSDLEIAVLLVVNAYKSQYRADMAQKDTGMSKALYASTLEKLNQQGKYIARNGITKEGRAVVAAFMPQEFSSTSKLRYFKGRFDGMQAPVIAPEITEPTRTGTPEEQAKADEALAMAQGVVQELGGTFEADGFATDATVGAWSYGKATVNGAELKLAASGGGVVQVNGKPHDPSGKVITTREQVREAILAVAPVQAVTGEEAGRFTRKWPLSVAEALEQGLISQKSGVWTVGIDNKTFGTGLEALDYYYEVVKPRDDARAIQDQSDEAKKRIAAVAAGVALPAYWDGDDAKYATPAGEVVNLTRRELRQRIFQLEEDFGREIVFAKSLEEFDLSVKAIPSDQEGDYMERPADVFNVLRALVDSYGWEKQAAKDIVKKTFDGVARAGAGTFDVYIQDGDVETIYARFGFDDFSSVKMEGKTNAQAAQEMEDKAQEHVQQRRKDIAERIEFEQRMTSPAPATNPDRTLLESIVAGTVEAASVDLDELEAIYNRNSDDAEMAALFEKAVDVVAQAESAATENV